MSHRSRHEGGVVPNTVRVVPEDLHLSAATVDMHADTVRVKHASADGRIEGAQRGLPASSAAVLISTVAKWQADSTPDQRTSGSNPATIADRLLALFPRESA
ncbi:MULTISPECIES: hypothetical protein [Mycolicibacterium]|jgi:hypothetical protein|uniref:Uncharacterized protein n=1 Tax=Mycolicibacterium holsaticum TaxID=152142 RepID=A0A1E3RUL2_9MYCO|nr:MULTISPECIES: hypothetical protein [Mycolicibacterium]MCB0940697.1 hypothetical protein [Mycobacterium sp.]ODQ93102.1 hypothetical protein BHQ17_14555 [Mycolicibacterium holsaticum]QZT63185.1 hypothetical protein JN085_01865 [Mycolicibacterium austroafricanum]